MLISRFVSTELLLGIQKAKTVFDQLPDQDLRDARTRSNPFESIASVIFQNRWEFRLTLTPDCITLGHMFIKTTALTFLSSCNDYILFLTKMFNDSFSKNIDIIFSSLIFPPELQ